MSVKKQQQEHLLYKLTASPPNTRKRQGRNRKCKNEKK